jgi:hypothetical protein
MNIKEKSSMKYKQIKPKNLWKGQFIMTKCSLFLECKANLILEANHINEHIKKSNFWKVKLI